MSRLFKSFGFMLIAVVGLGVFAQDAQAHAPFKKILEKKFPKIKVKCDACHVPKQPKTERNKFGKLFYKQLKDQELTAKWRELETRKEKKAFEAEVMTPAFTKALEKVKEMTNDEEEKYGDLIAAAKIEFIEMKEDE